MRANVLFPTWNRGLISRKALGRVDVDRTRLSAEVYTNWLPSTQGSMQLRPGTKHFGNSLNDTGAAWIEFVASTDDVALPELTHQKMRIWLGSDAHDLALLSRPKVDTTVSLTDTGWSNASTGGNAAVAIAETDAIPTMSAATTDGVTIEASSEWVSGGREAWRAADDSINSYWRDTGASGDGVGTLPSWWKVDFGAGNTRAVASYSIRAWNGPTPGRVAPSAWTLQSNDVDTGTGWTTVDSQSGETSWATAEKKTYTRLDADTGAIEAFRYWRLNFTAGGSEGTLAISEMELFALSGAAQAEFSGTTLTLNATSIGARAIARKRVIVDTGDSNVEHSLAIRIDRGPVTCRVGSTDGDDDYIREASLGTGHHNLALTPESNFHITLQSDAIVNRIVSSLAIGDSGTVEITTPWDAADLDDVRYDQSADVVYADCEGVRQQKIERRGTGRSWSVVDYAPNDGPFLPVRSGSAKLRPSAKYGNTRIRSDIPFFQSGHVGALVRVFHEGQSVAWPLGAKDATTDAIEVTGIGTDTGNTPPATTERTITFSGSGTWAGTVTFERSFDGPDRGFKTIPESLGSGTDTGTFSKTISDRDDNAKIWYRARVTTYTSGVVVVTATYDGGGITGIGRITGYNSNTDVDIEVLERFSDTGPSDNWQQGYWSDARGFPTAVALHGGRLSHAQGGSLFLSVADDFESFDDTVEGDAAPIIRTLGSGPVDTIQWLASLLRLIIGTEGSELTLRSSSIDEPVTPANSSAGAFSTQGSAALRAVKMDNRAIYVQRSRQRVFMVGAGSQGATFGDYEGFELTLLVPDLLEEGVVSMAIQRQPDTRLHCVLADGTVAILTYEPQEEVICWTLWETDGLVEKAMVLPGLGEDAVYYHVNRTINGATKRFLEKWALESECQGDTGLHWLADCAASYSDTGRTTLLNGVATHLVGESLVVWGSLDTGSTPHVDLSPGYDGSQTTWAVDTGGDVALTGLTQGVHHAVVGLPYTADWKSTKLAYNAQAGTAVAQVKRVGQIAFVLFNCHRAGLRFGSDTGHLDPLPQMIEGAVVDPDTIHDTLDLGAVPFPGTHGTDERFHLRAQAPRPAGVLGSVPSTSTNERV